MNHDWKQAKSSRPATTGGIPHQSRRIADHPLGILALAGNHALTGVIGQQLRVQRAPGDPPPPPATPILGGNGANGVVRLYHYGDLSSRAEFSSPPGYPRLTDYDQGISQADAATYTGTPTGPKPKYKYELQIDQDYFDKNFRNTGTRKGYSEYTTAKAEKIPTTYFRRVGTLTGAAGGGGPGGSPPGSAGGTPPISGGTQTPTKAKASDGAPEAKLSPPKVETPPAGGGGTGATSTRLGVGASRLRSAGRFLAEAAPGLLVQVLLMMIFPPKVHIHTENYDALSRQKIDPALQRALAEQASKFNKLAANDPAQSIWATVTVESEYKLSATSGGDLDVVLHDLRFIDMRLTQEYLLVEGPRFQVGKGATASQKVTYSVPIFGPATHGSEDAIRSFRAVRKGLTSSSYKVRLSAILNMYKITKSDTFLNNQLVRDIQPMLNDDDSTVREVAALVLKRINEET